MIWQPIASIPKDGTLVLVIDDFGDHDFASWHNDHVCGEGSGRANFTHWMPLPPPPKDERSEG